jgi:hypothetical protein
MVGMDGTGIALGSSLEEGVGGLGIVPLRYPITPWDFTTEMIDSFHLAQFELSNFSSIGNTKFDGCDIVVFDFDLGQVYLNE